MPDPFLIAGEDAVGAVHHVLQAMVGVAVEGRAELNHRVDGEQDEAETENADDGDQAAAYGLHVCVLRRISIAACCKSKLRTPSK